MLFASSFTYYMRALFQLLDGNLLKEISISIFISHSASQNKFEDIFPLFFEISIKHEKC